MMELDKKYVLHIPLYKYKNNELIPIEIYHIIEDLIKKLDKEGYDSLYITDVKAYYKSRSFDEILISIFTSEEVLKKENKESPSAIFKKWFKEHNYILEQEALGYEYDNKMYIEEL